MSISFNEVPDGRVPFTYIEFDNTGAQVGESVKTYKALILGQKSSSSTASANTITQIYSADDARAKFGAGSLLHELFKKWFKNNTYTDVYAGVLTDDPSAVAAVKTLTLTGTATADGTFALYVAGRLISVGVSSSETAATLAAAILTKFTSLNTTNPFPCSCSVSNAVVTFTANWKGATGNQIDIRMNASDGDATPAGITWTVATATSGAVNPDLTSLISAMAGTQYDFLVNPYTDSTSISALLDELEDRWSASRQQECVAFMAYNDTLSNLATWGNAKNSQLLCTIGECDSPSPEYEWAAAFAATVAKYGSIDPARPFKTLKLTGIVAPSSEKQFTTTEQNSLLYDGISSWTVDASGYVCLGRVITMYQTNSDGAVDTSYLDLNTILTLAYIRYDTRTFITSKYPRHKLAGDGTKYASGQAIVTPSIMKSELISRARLWEENGLVENVDTFKSGLVVERNADDVNRLDIQMTPDLINQFLIAGIQIKFIL
jgi:phage tail sheath gpL-like